MKHGSFAFVKLNEQETVGLVPKIVSTEDKKVEFCTLNVLTGEKKGYWFPLPKRFPSKHQQTKTDCPNESNEKARDFEVYIK